MPFLIILGIALLGVMVYFAIDKKSSFHMRLAALGAIALMILTVIICVIVYQSHNKAPVDWSIMNLDDFDKEPEKEGGAFAIIFSIIFLLILFVVIAVLAMREHKKHKKN